MTISYLHGIETVEVDDGSTPVSTLKTNLIGLIGTAPDADAALFPLNTPVLLFANTTKAAALGTDGTLLDAIKAIYDQSATQVVVVRVAEGTTQAETWSNTVGSSAAKTGVWSFLNTRPVYGIEPKILIAPGLTTDRPTNGIVSAAVGAGGNGYVQSGTTVTFAAAPAGGRTAKGVAQVVGGSVTGITVTDGGYGYTSAPTVTIAGAGTGATATATLGHVANPVAVALGAYAARRRAVALVDGPGTNAEDAVAYRNDFDSDRIMVIDPGVLAYDTVSSAYVARPGSAYFAGIQARVDNTDGFWFSASNRTINNVGGAARPIDWMSGDPESEANFLNSNEITTVIHTTGYRFWGLRSTTSNPVWAFLNVRRTADAIYEAIENALVDKLDKPFSPALLRSIIASVQDYLDLMTARGALIGGKCWIDPSINTPATFQAGQLTVDFDLEPPACLEHLTFRTHRNNGYYTEFVSQFSTTVVG